MCVHEWQYLWGDSVRRCVTCRVYHYYHFCEERWEDRPNPGFRFHAISKKAGGWQRDYKALSPEEGIFDSCGGFGFGKPAGMGKAPLALLRD